jgi:hypothetical protein
MIGRRRALPALAAAGWWLPLGCARPRAAAPPPGVSPPAPPPAPEPATAPRAWRSLFDGKDLAPWVATSFGGEGLVRLDGGKIVLHRGDPLTGVHWGSAGGPLPKVDYEVALEAMKVDGGDFFCCLTFPVAASWCSFVVGGWGGGVVGLSSLDGLDASENETSRLMSFDRHRWYRIRVSVLGGAIAAWIDEDKVVDVPTRGRTISLRPEVEPCRPLGVASYRTTAALRSLKLRQLA